MPRHAQESEHLLAARYNMWAQCFSCPDMSMLICIQRKNHSSPGLTPSPPMNFFCKLYEECLDNSYYRKLSSSSIFCKTQHSAFWDIEGMWKFTVVFPGKNDFNSLSTLFIPLYFRHRSKVLSSFISFHSEEQEELRIPVISLSSMYATGTGESEEPDSGRNQVSCALSLKSFSQEQEPGEL